MIAEMMLYVICADLVPAPLGETVEITVIPTLTAMRHGAIHALTTPALSLVTSDVLLMQTVGTHVTNVCKDYVKKLAVGLAVQIIEIVNLLLVTNVYVAFALSEVVAQSVKLVTIVLGKKIVLLVHLLRVEKKICTSRCGMPCANDQQCYGAYTNCGLCLHGICQVSNVCGIGCQDNTGCTGAGSTCKRCNKQNKTCDAGGTCGDPCQTNDDCNPSIASCRGCRGGFCGS